jgi:uncharacterized protein (TIGR03000 family)
MNRLCLARSVLPILGVLAGSAGASPPAGASVGPTPYFGSPGTFGPTQFSYPAPGAYGSTSFNPFTVPSLSSAWSPYNVAMPDEWPAVAAARVTVRLPADAKLWVDGKSTKQTGAVREFVTPPVLRAGVTYRYQFRAEWTHDDKTVTRDLPAYVRATGSADIDFTKP